MGIVYNADSVDEEPRGFGLYPPTVGIKVLHGPLADANDAMDNDQDGLVDEAGEEILMSGFSGYDNTDHPVNGGPATAGQFYNYLKGVARDGSAFPYCYNVRPNHPASRFAYPLNTDPYGFSVGGSMQHPIPVPYCSMDSIPYSPIVFVRPDYRIVMSAGPFTFRPGESFTYELAVITAQHTPGGDSSIPRIQSAADTVLDFYKRRIATGIKTQRAQALVTLAPNPAQTEVELLGLSAGATATVSIVDMAGRTQIQQKMKGSLLNVASLKAGMYSLRVEEREQKPIYLRMVKE
jgi:hypothetical protein